jgi:trehalose 2-sulfotransferase
MNRSGMRSYMICAVPRTGSYLLCDLLEKTGVAGRPNEYFNPTFQSQWTVDWGTDTFPEYLEKVVELGTTKNGVFGLKAHPMQFDSLCRQLARRGRVPFARRPELLKRQFPELRYVLLRRRNRLQQAVSYVRAIQTRAWWDSDQAPGPNGPVEPERLRFDFQLIERAIELLEAMDRRWNHYFAATGVTPLEFDYEDLTADPHGAARTVLDVLGVTAPAGWIEESTPFRRQADDLTDEWLSRFQRIRDDLPLRSPTSALTGASAAPHRFREWTWSESTVPSPELTKPQFVPTPTI